jgi:hypothetical protein
MSQRGVQHHLTQTASTEAEVHKETLAHFATLHDSLGPDDQFRCCLFCLHMVHSEPLGMRWALKQLKRNCGKVWRPPHGGDTLGARLWPDDSQARFTGHLPT